MGHIPHLLLPPPWGGPEIPLSAAHLRHLRRVLRLGDGADLSYSDGAGNLGGGVLRGEAVVRGSERAVPRPEPEVSVAVAPPAKGDRVRYLVEKLAELGVDRLIWLTTRFGEGRIPRPDKAAAWAQSALEQSRGAWILQFDGPVRVDELTGASTLWVTERESFPPPSVAMGGIVVVGPEAGFAEGEVPAAATRIGLGRRILRVETAAIVGATLLLDRSGRLTPAEIP